MVEGIAEEGFAFDPVNPSAAVEAPGQEPGVRSFPITLLLEIKLRVK